MSYQIIWSSFAEKQLTQIFDYYKEVANHSIASKIVSDIIITPNKLLENTEIGQIEELIHREIKYRYFLHKNYKTVYSIDTELNFIKIADVFDTRQNPIKIQRNT